MSVWYSFAAMQNLRGHLSASLRYRGKRKGGQLYASPSPPAPQGLSELGVRNEIRYFGATGDTFGHLNTEYNIGTDTDTGRMIPNDFFGIFEFPTPAKNLHNIPT